MRFIRPATCCVSAIFCLVIANAAWAADPPAKDPDWHMNATIIEACSCPMFCQCYFDTKPAAHSDKDPHAGHAGHAAAAGAEHYFKFNNAFQVNKGHYGQVKLDGAKF